MKMTHVSASKVKHRRQKNSPQHSGIMKGENLELGLKFCFQILFGTLAINFALLFVWCDGDYTRPHLQDSWSLPNLCLHE